MSEELGEERNFRIRTKSLSDKICRLSQELEKKDKLCRELLEIAKRISPEKTNVMKWDDAVEQYLKDRETIKRAEEILK